MKLCRWLRRGSVLVGMMALLLGASCAPTPQVAEPGAPGGPTLAPAAPTKPTPQRGGTLVYATINPGTSLHPFKGGSADILRHVGPAYETLLSFDYQPDQDYRIDYRVVPWLAESWEQPNDTTYIFKIRKGVKWHDGVDFTAEDVLFTYNWASDSQNAFQVKARLKDVANIEAPDRYTLKIITKTPTALFLQELAERNFYVVPKHVFDRGDDFNKVLIGTGPFKLKAFETPKQTLWTRNESYWQEGRPYLDGMQQIWGLDASAMTAAFVAGKNDLLLFTDKAQLDAATKVKPDLRYNRWLTDNGVSFYPKVDKPPFNDVRVRRAVHLGVDRQAMIRSFTFGEGVINPPGVPGFKTGWAIPQEELLKLPGYRQPKDPDITEAKRLLAEAGYPSGFKFTILYNSGGVVYPRVAEILSQQLKAIGLEVVLDGREAASYNKLQEEGAFESTVVVTARADLTGYIVDYFHSKGGGNRVGINDPKLDGYIEAISRTFDVEQRKRVVLDMQRYMLETLYAIPTVENATFGAYQPWVGDFMHTAGNALAVYQDSASRIWLDLEKLPADRR